MSGQKELVLEYMRKHGSITSQDAFRDLGITRLSAVIFNLRKAGFAIDSDTEHSENRYGVDTSYSRYSLNKEPVQLELFK